MRAARNAPRPPAARAGGAAPGSGDGDQRAQQALGGGQDQRAQRQQQADGERRRPPEDLGVGALRVDGGGRDRQVLRRDDLAQPAADGVGGQQQARIQVRAGRRRGLQVGEQGARGRLGRTW